MVASSLSGRGARREFEMTSNAFRCLTADPTGVVTGPARLEASCNQARRGRLASSPRAVLPLGARVMLLTFCPMARTEIRAPRNGHLGSARSMSTEYCSNCGSPPTARWRTPSIPRDLPQASRARDHRWGCPRNEPRPSYRSASVLGAAFEPDCGRADVVLHPRGYSMARPSRCKATEPLRPRGGPDRQCAHWNGTCYSRSCWFR